jgi:hypothetical protein
MLEIKFKPKLNPSLIVALCIFFILSLPAQAKRLALVIGNDNYTAVSKLQKAGNDATAMARELKTAGFTVQLHRDLNYLGMVKAVESFTKGITGGDEVVVFFAGHGVQIKNGSYLLPTDIEASSESQVEKTAYELLALTDKISEAKPAFSLILVDACRDNPLKSQGRNIGNARGLSAIEPPKGQMVVYSASRGQQALDRLGENDPNPNSVFTREFIVRMKKPGIKIEDLMKEVQDSVETLAKTVSHEQRPAFYNEARGNFYFVKDGDRKFSNLTESTQTTNLNDIKRIVHVTGMVVENNKRIVQDWINERSGWIEYKDDKIFTTYIEVERTFNSIILFDKSRKLFAKIVVSRSSDSVSIYWNPGELNSPPKEWWLLPFDYRVLR